MNTPVGGLGTFLFSSSKSCSNNVSVLLTAHTGSCCQGWTVRLQLCNTAILKWAQDTLCFLSASATEGVREAKTSGRLQRKQQVPCSSTNLRMWKEYPEMELAMVLRSVSPAPEAVRDPVFKVSVCYIVSSRLG